jgi:hypothetical protein
MKHACEKATYIAALAFVSRDVHEHVSVEPQLWWEVAHLSRSSFYRGLRYCEARELLSYKKMHSPFSIRLPGNLWTAGGTLPRGLHTNTQPYS